MWIHAKLKLFQQLSILWVWVWAVPGRGLLRSCMCSCEPLPGRLNQAVPCWTLLM